MVHTSHPPQQLRERAFRGAGPLENRSMSSPRRSVLPVLLGSSLALVGGLAAAPIAHAVDTTSPVVISEVYGGGGNGGANGGNNNGGGNNGR